MAESKFPIGKILSGAGCLLVAGLLAVAGIGVYLVRALFTGG